MLSNMWLALFSGAVVAATPILFAATGEILTERSGVMNLGQEGMLLMGAVTGFITVVKTGSLALSILMVIIVGAVMGLLFAFLTVTLQANQVVSGLAFTLFGTGLSGFIGKSVNNTAVTNSFHKIEIPGLSSIPFLGNMFFKQDLMVYALYIIIFCTWFYIFKTKAGMELRAIGENPGAADAVGINIFARRYLNTCIGGILAALGGAYITLAYSPMWRDGLTAGKGWIAIALVIFSTWNPVMAAVGALLFGGIEVFGLRLQALGIQIPSHFVSMLPYFFTVIVLIFATGNFRQKKQALSPKSLGEYYDREAR